jgi:hypothetical protein
MFSAILIPKVMYGCSQHYILYRALTTFKLEGEVTSLSESSQGEVGRFLTGMQDSNSQGRQK